GEMAKIIIAELGTYYPSVKSCGVLKIPSHIKVNDSNLTKFELEDDSYKLTTLDGTKFITIENKILFEEYLKLNNNYKLLLNETEINYFDTILNCLSKLNDEGLVLCKYDNINNLWKFFTKNILKRKYG